MVDLLVENPLLLLFLVLGIGYLVGRVSIRGFSLGISAVLFVGLGFGALDPELRLPDFVYLFGLILFVYTVGVAAGPGFVAAFRRGGLRDNLLVAAVLGAASGVVAGGARLLGLSGSFSAGIFTGALTNTPALAAVLQFQTDRAVGAGLDRALAEPVVGYSVAYPFGVLGMVLAIYVFRRTRRARSEERSAEVAELLPEELVNRTALVASPEVVGRSIAELMQRTGWRVIFSRHRSGEHVVVPTPGTVLRTGDLVVVCGEASDVAVAVEGLGGPADEELTLDRSEIDFRRIFVSNDRPLGVRLSDLRLPERYGAVVTRVRRGDTDRMARPNTVLEPGDRIRVVAPRERMDEVTRFFGDSFRKLSEIDAASFSLGLVLGLAVGMIPFPLPGGTAFRLGPAGGPLVVGLILGAVAQTGPFTWQLPYNAGLTLRQLGALLFLAGVGTRSGYAFVETLRDGGGLAMLGLGATVTVVAAALTLGVGTLALHIPGGILIGVLSGLQTQPAVLAFAAEQTGDELPDIGYATVYPVATLAKILLAQALLALLG